MATKSKTFSCEKCCSMDATCYMCGLQDEAAGCTANDTVGISKTKSKGDKCDKGTFKEDTECYECKKCNRANYAPTPDVSTECEGVVFEQTQEGDYPECKMVYEAYGTKDCSATCETCGYQSNSLACSSGQAAVSRTLSAGSVCDKKTVAADLECYECVNCNYQNFDWTPLPSEVCQGVAFEQTKTGQHPNCVIKRPNYGTKQGCNSGDATCFDCGLDSSSQCNSGQAAVSRSFSKGNKCNNKEFAQDTECYECVDCLYNDYEWTPAASTICVGVEFEQTKKGKHPNCIIKKIEVGTKPKVPGAWGPSCQTDTVCAGVSFICTQYRDDGCGVTETQRINVTGTKNCVCCNSAMGCTYDCPGSGCTPSDGYCCDTLCVGCGDCGEGGEMCCNSVEIKSLFEDLKNDSESMQWEALKEEATAVWGADSLEKIIPIFTKWGILDDGYWKTSILTRPYILDCVEDVLNGSDFGIAYSKHHAIWAKIATTIRS